MVTLQQHASYAPIHEPNIVFLSNTARHVMERFFFFPGYPMTCGKVDYPRLPQPPLYWFGALHGTRGSSLDRFARALGPIVLSPPPLRKPRLQSGPTSSNREAVRSSLWWVPQMGLGLSNRGKTCSRYPKCAPSYGHGLRSRMDWPYSMCASVYTRWCRSHPLTPCARSCCLGPPLGWIGNARAGASIRVRPRGVDP